MKCGKPKRLKDARRVPCGKCAACLSERPKDWAARINLEFAAHPLGSSFVTLTFSDEHLPRTRKRVQQFVRIATRGLPYRYLLVSERGGLYGRFHFHMICFGLSPLEAKAYWLSRWRYGFVDVKDAQGKACYASKYVVKDSHSKDIQEFYSDGLGPNVFRQCRPAIGALVVPAMAKKLVSDSEAVRRVRLFHDVDAVHRMNGVLVRTPLYVKRKLREAVGLPSSSVLRSEVQKIRRLDSLSDTEYFAACERRRSGASILADIRASRERSSRVHLDPQLVPAEKALSLAVKAGRYETRSARRRRLSLERKKRERLGAPAVSVCRE